MVASPEAVRLASKLRDLRESQEPKLTQAMLADALSAEEPVAVSTISSWESLSTPKLPPAERLHSYALFFASDPPRLIPGGELSAVEQRNFQELHQELIGLRDAVHGGARPASTWKFEDGPITIICPEVPEDERSPLANEADPNYTRMYRYADLDALIELVGHLRAVNPELTVVHRLPSEFVHEDLSSHVVVLGGVAWNQLAKRMLRIFRELPVSQVEVPELETGEIFRSSSAGGQEFWPVWDEVEGVRMLAEDVALLARLRNPFKHGRTVTICNGIHSRGVLGAVRTLTDADVRERNEAYLAEHFPGGSFALLLRVLVVGTETISPDLEIAANRLFEWSPKKKASAE
ncbi:XRE family transcriptional regulator [Kribbella sandramycini]|uniref:XRE family transcriptional regulator n=1 Tax=Kribbella sandramycini TaxID=60450 RepID=A0A7Y4KWF4_9ACTN|nr:XRE family transcriptional regulator [Kribbella sandramycini]MBB6567429.1 hypothetical protein [Kribbella sandramycini]NOL39960.1 XRE family transcriptional regulator [Kribbella sandramycini]